MFFDIHVHSGPAAEAERRLNDIELGRAYAAAGHVGCVLKGHFEPTVGRAAAVAEATGIEAYGGIVLNRPAGGLNPDAVAAALAGGGRVVWLPTIDASAHVERSLPRCCVDARYPIRPADYALPTGPETAGRPPDAEMLVARICELVADADAVLATGHIGPGELRWLLPLARAHGVRRLILTHPSYTVPDLDAAATRELTAQGAYAEVCAYQVLHQRGMDVEGLAAFVREVGTDSVLLSSDAGQVDSPPPPEALEWLVDVLSSHGLDRGALVAAASERPLALVRPGSAPKHRGARPAR
ncbi:MAG: DUF6282 family protein [Actinomycetia bacterium]|nr:DUF6282 family protein [Actinomycetes bacterium]